MTPVAARLARTGPPAVATLGGVLFLLAAGHRIDLPGLYYDEALFVNGALGGVADDFVHQRVLGVPFMLFPYIGALKAWIYVPIFQAFGVSPATIRWPAVAIALATLAILHRVGHLLVGRRWAAVLAVLMATDPAFVYTSRLDWGPVVLMNLCKATSLACLFTLLHDTGARTTRGAAWWLAASLVLGFFDKLNFIWFMVGLGVSTLAVYPREAALAWHRGGRALLAPVASCLALCAAIAWFLMRPVLAGAVATAGDDWGTRVRHVAALYRVTVSGEGVYGFVFGEALGMPGWTQPISSGLVVAAVAALVFRAVRRRMLPAPDGGAVEAPGDHRAARAFLFCGILFAVICAQMAATPQTGGAHHVMMLFPLWHLLAVLGAANMRAAMTATRRAACGVALALILGVMVASQLVVLWQYRQALRDDGRFSVAWSPGIYDLADYLERRESGVAAVVSADWGIQTPLFALASPASRLKYVDGWPSFAGGGNEAAVTGLLEGRLRGERVLIVTHAPGAEVMAGTRDTALRLAGRSRAMRLETTIVRGGRALYEVYAVDAAVPAR